MSDGRTHDRLTRRWAFLTGFSLAWSTTVPVAITYAGSLFISGYFLSPDLDTRSIPFKRWGVLRYLWEPYRVLIPHRSPLSHGPFIGTLIRLIYLGAWICIFSIPTLWLTHFFWTLPFDGRTAYDVLKFVIVDNWMYWVIAFAGLEAGAAVHYLADIRSSFIKRLKRQLNPFRALGFK